VLTALDPSGAATSVNGTAHGKYVPTSNGSFTPNITASDKTIYSTQKLSESDLLALATAKDQTDGDISKNITITDKGGFKPDDTNAAGTYTIAYAVTNSSGNTSTATSTITVKADQTSTKAKDSTLVAGPDTKWNAADNFVSATDADGNGIDFKSVNVSGSVDPTKPGDYEVTYSYTDAGGNQVSAKATITVVSTKASIKAKDSTLVAGPDTKWNAADNFVSATDADGNGIDAKSVNVSGSVDPTKPGDYEVTYSYTDAGGNQVSAKATITVVSTKASIKAKDSTLVAGPDTKWNAVDNFVSATGADGTGIDFKSVNVSGSVDPTKPGDYEVTYSYTDAGGNQVSAKATITVVSSKANINGHDSTIDQGDSWTPQNNFDGGTDAEGNVIDFREIVVEGTVDSNVPGKYKVTYSYTDQEGNVFQKTVTITVLAKHSNPT
ncbi:bacterial Ig-like domain-containing protein, partial [Lacticaseibacillus paracasei]